MLKVTPDLSVLSAAKQGLVYLTANDWALIADKAVRRQFKPGEMLVQRDRRTHGIYLLLKGTAAVEITSQEPRAIGPGEVCGEISFLDELPATAMLSRKSPSKLTIWTTRPCARCLNYSRIWVPAFTTPWRPSCRDACGN